MLKKENNRLERNADFVAIAYAPMFLRVHSKPRASDGPENAIFFRDLPLFFNQQDQTVVCEAIKRSFLKHATTWLNPTNVAVSVFCNNLLFPLSADLARSSLYPGRSTLTKCCGYRSHLRPCFSGKNKCAACLQYCDARFRRSIDITIVLANVSLVNCQLSWRGRKCATARGVTRGRQKGQLPPPPKYFQRPLAYKQRY